MRGLMTTDGYLLLLHEGAWTDGDLTLAPGDAALADADEIEDVDNQPVLAERVARIRAALAATGNGKSGLIAPGYYVAKIGVRVSDPAALLARAREHAERDGCEGIIHGVEDALSWLMGCACAEYLGAACEVQDAEIEDA